MTLACSSVVEKSVELHCDVIAIFLSLKTELAIMNTEFELSGSVTRTLMIVADDLAICADIAALVEVDAELL
jgi:hypothetical protein